MAENLGWSIQPHFQMAYIRHSLVTCNTLKPQTEPIPLVNMQLISHGRTPVDTFFEYPKVTKVLKPGYNLVIVVLGGNDIGAKADVVMLRHVQGNTTTSH